MLRRLPLLLLLPLAASADPLPDGAELRLGRPVTFSITAEAAFSPDGKRVATVPPNTSVHVWEVESGKRLSGTRYGPSSNLLGWSKEGKLRGVFQGGEGILLHEWADTDDKGPDEKLLAKLRGTDDFPPDKKKYVWRRALSADGQRMAVVFGVDDKDRTVAVYSPKPDIPLKWTERDLSVSLPGCEFVGFSGDGNTLFAIQPYLNKWGRVTAYNLSAKEPEEPAWVLDLPEDPNWQDATKWKGRPNAVLSADGKRIVIEFSHHGGVEVWDGPSGKKSNNWESPLSILTGGGERAQLAVSPDGKRLAISSREKTGLMGGVVYDLDTGKEAVKLVAGPNVSDWGLKYSPDGKRLYRSYQVWAAETGKELSPVTGHRGNVRSVLVSGDGKTIVTGGDDGTARGWDATTGEEKWRADFPYPVTLRRLDADTAVVSEGYGSMVIEKPLVTLSTGKVAELPGDMAKGTIVSGGFGERREPLVAVTPDGKTAVTLDRQAFALKLWDWPKGKLRSTLKFDPPEKTRFGGVRGVAFTPDGKELVGTFEYPEYKPTPGSGPAFRGVMCFERWDLSGEKRVERSTDKWLVTPSLAANGKRVLALNKGSVIDALTGEVVFAPTEEQKRTGRVPVLSGAVLSPDGDTLVAPDGWSGEGIIQWFDLKTGKEIATRTAGYRCDGPLAFLPDGRLVSGGEQVLVWKAVKN